MTSAPRSSLRARVTPHVLLVDDEASVLRGLRRLLKQACPDWRVLTAQSGFEALDVLARERVDILVTDLQMPGMDGIELLQVVKSRFPTLPRIVHSSRSDLVETVRDLELADTLLLKPAVVDQLMNAIVEGMALSLTETPSSDRAGGA